MRKTTRKKIAPIVITVLVIAYIAPLMAIVLGTMGLWSGGESVNVMFPLLCWLIVGGAGVAGAPKAPRGGLGGNDGGGGEGGSPN